MNQNFCRRNWLKTMSAGMAGMLVAQQGLGRTTNGEDRKLPFNASLALADPKDSIKITRLEIIPVHSLRTIFIKMHTDAGIIGIGEGTVEGRIYNVMAAIKELEAILIGKDPRRVAHHWQAMYRHAFYRGDIVLTSAFSAVDIAMWDIKGKALGVPIYELLGGPTRDRIRLIWTGSKRRKVQKQLIAEGYQSMKVGVTSSRGQVIEVC